MSANSFVGFVVLTVDSYAGSSNHTESASSYDPHSEFVWTARRKYEIRAVTSYLLPECVSTLLEFQRFFFVVAVDLDGDVVLLVAIRGGRHRVLAVLAFELCFTVVVDIL